MLRLRVWPRCKLVANKNCSEEARAVVNDIRTFIDALKHRRTYPHETGDIQVIETHISVVALTGTYAYKLKKPAKFEFLNFSSLPARKYFCDEEFRLNQRTAPNLYLGVVPLRQSDRGLAFGGYGVPVEYAVKMRQFPEASRLDVMASHDALTQHELAELARVIADFHGSLPPERVEPGGFVRNVRDRTCETLSTLCNALPERAAEITAFSEGFNKQFVELEPMMRERVRSGSVRECHGDLHMANVAFINGEPTPFDCLEFDRSLRTIDVMGDIAFLAMDLQMRGNARTPTALLDKYLERTGDYGGLPLERVFRIDRALVRAKVAALSSPGSEMHGKLAAYLDQALASLTVRDKPLLILTYGLSGSGKSSCAEALAERVGAIRIRTDVERKRLTGLRADASSHSELNGGIYSKTWTERTYSQVAEFARASLCAGHHTIVDASFLQQERRAAFITLANELALPWCIVETTAPIDVLKDRVKKRHALGEDASEANLQVLEDQVLRTLPLRDIECRRRLVVRTDVHSHYQQDLDCASAEIQLLAESAPKASHREPGAIHSNCVAPSVC